MVDPFPSREREGLRACFRKTEAALSAAFRHRRITRAPERHPFRSESELASRGGFAKEKEYPREDSNLRPVV